MIIMRTEKDILTKDDILKYIKDYQDEVVPKLDKLWRYFKVDNPTIKDKKQADINNPDNRTPSGYAKKIITTFTGYAWRARYTTYKAEGFESYMNQLQETFDLTNEHIKTSKIGRNIGIFGNSKEVLYIDGIKTTDKKLPTKAEVRVSTVDPRYMITLYDYSEEPKLKIAIKWDIISDLKHTVDVFYMDKIERYTKTRKDKYTQDWKLDGPEIWPNFFKEVPCIDYWLEEDAEGLIKPIVPYIDDLDQLTSGGIDEFMRFAESYLRVVGGSLDNPDKTSANDVMKALRRLKKTRIFTRLKDKEDVTFLTKDIPAEYIKFITGLIIDQIHIQSHVPDFAKFKDLSGVAVQRLMFDFENVCSTAEANVDVGLIRRIELINKFYEMMDREAVPTSKITISHKRNAPLNLKEYAETAVLMKQAGYSRYLIADIMPDDIIPDVQEELDRQTEDMKTMFDGIEMPRDDNEIRETSVQPPIEERT